MTIPRDLSLKLTPTGTRLFSKPVKELEALRIKQKKLNLPIATYPVGLAELIVDIDLDKTTADDVAIKLSNNVNESIAIGFDKTTNQFYIDRTNLKDTAFSKVFARKHFAPRKMTSDILSLHLFIDDASVELFADDGSVVMTDIFFPKEKLGKLSLTYDKGNVSVKKAVMYSLKSAW